MAWQSATILCALEVERRHLTDAAPLAECGNPALVTVGPGPGGIRRYLESRQGSLDDPVILAGVCGSLHHAIEPGRAFAASRIVDTTGRHWSTTWPPSDAHDTAGLSMIAVLGADAPLTTSAAKRNARSQFHADVVDTESHALGHWMSQHGKSLHWGVVRGVVDAHDETLPYGVERWIDEAGRIRPLRITADLITHPSSMAHLTRLRRTTAQALDAVAGLIADLLRHTQHDDR